MLSDRFVRRALVATAAAVIPVAATVLSPAWTASAQPCPDVEVVFARGTSEAPGVGRVGQALADSLRAQLGGRTVGTYGVNYPATYDFLNAAGGATDAENRIALMAQQCPGTRIVLGGYSQGAAVVDMLAGVPPLGNRIGNIGSAPPLAGSLNGNVAAVAVFGNPATKFGNPVSATGSFAGKAIDLCADGDPICSDGRNPFAHTRYETPEFIGPAAGFVAGRV
ncbi:Cutinase [Mycobacterium sp. THAF192]|nr:MULTISPECIES: cutinase family protein [Mycolicibacterium]MCG7579084.1 cutinase family protein [Mycolicibacterium sp. OfavD-34-C]QFS90214.1 Cutinase [Mycobacterium sp. THAF192]